MAPLGSVIKNGIIFSILSAVIIYFSSRQIVLGFRELFIHVIDDRNNSATLNSAFSNIFVGMLILILGVGLVLHKTLSDTVEEGMIEF